MGVPFGGLSPTINIFELNLTNPAINTLVITDGAVTEIGLGWYRFDFLTYDPTQNYVYTIDGGDILSVTERYKIGGNESFVEDISSEVWNEQAMDHLQSGSTGFLLQATKSDTTSIAVSQTTITALVNSVLKYERNRTKVNVLDNTLTIYEDNGTDVLTVFNLFDHNGNPSLSEVAERVPQ
jgi:hypothetical protein